MRISQNNSDISGLVWCVAARRDQIADALWIASTFDTIGSTVRVDLDGRGQRYEHFLLMRKGC